MNDKQHIIPNVSGLVTYDVLVKYPHCNKRLPLNQYPYNDEDSEYSSAENDLWMALFGGEVPHIEYTCCGCKKKFALARLEV